MNPAHLMFVLCLDLLYIPKFELYRPIEMNGYYATPYSCQAFIENKSSRTTLLCDLTQVAIIKFKNSKAESTGLLRCNQEPPVISFFNLK